MFTIRTEIQLFAVLHPYHPLQDQVEISDRRTLGTLPRLESSGDWLVFMAVEEFHFNNLARFDFCLTTVNFSSSAIRAKTFSFEGSGRLFLLLSAPILTWFGVV